MFGFLKKIFNKTYTSNFQEFFDFVQKKSDTNSSEMFATFSPQGFSLTVDLMISKAQHDLDMFIKDTKLFLDPLKMIRLEQKIESFTKTGGMAVVSTFGGEVDPQLKALEKKYPQNFKYVPLNCSNANEVNSFIIVDNKSYLIDDPLFNKIDGMCKAEVNFFDYSKSATLIQNFKKYTGVYSGNII